MNFLKFIDMYIPPKGGMPYFSGIRQEKNYAFAIAVLGEGCRVQRAGSSRCKPAVGSRDGGERSAITALLNSGGNGKACRTWPEMLDGFAAETGARIGHDLIASKADCMNKMRPCIPGARLPDTYPP